MRTDRQTDRLRCIAVHRNVVEVLRSIAVHCRNVAEGLQTTVVLYGACGASSAPCGGVHQILSPHNSGTLRKRYRKLTDHGNACGPLQCVAVCTTVHYGALRKRCRSRVDHWNASKLLQFTTTHCGASSACCGECITHSRKRQNSVYLPYHLANPQKPIANP